MTRPGFGTRHPALAALLSAHEPAASHEIAWAGGTLPLRVSAYTSVVPLPEEIVTSVRCIVIVEGSLVFCQNADGSHPWPGGRRLPGEAYLETAAREVHEETGWLLQPETATQLGWLHLAHLAPRRHDDGLPYPDFLQIVFCARAHERSVERDGAWTDSDGYETSNRLVTLDEAMAATSNDILAPVFLRLLFEKLRAGEIV